MPDFVYVVQAGVPDSMLASPPPLEEPEAPLLEPELPLEPPELPPLLEPPELLDAPLLLPEAHWHAP